MLILPLFLEDTMFDFLLLAAGTGFFAVCLAYVFACNRL
jgi:hypothetical protein